MSTPEHPDHRAGIIAGLSAYTVWGLLTIYWKQLHEFDAFELIGWRVCAASVLMAIVLTVTRRWKRVIAIRRDPRLLGRVAAAAFFLTVNWTTYVYAVVHGHVLETALGYFTAPIGTVLVGVLILHESLRPAQKLSLGFAAAAVVVLTIANGTLPWIAILLTVSWVWYGYLKKHVPLSPAESMAAEVFLLLPIAVTVAIWLGSRPGSIPHTASHMELGLAALTGLVTVTPLTLFAFAAQRVPLTTLGPMQYLVPSMNFFIGWLMYDESLPPSRMAGFALVWLALAVLTVDGWQRSRRVMEPDALEPAC
ncbi:MAG: EamA family transporter RarD [Ilumatobacteraceae bacterium]|nr:EamA family transporter RarD [Ilumatobacter sp.]MCB9379110.1 EamA family transporter RarD [Acidimicrobiaceae bacterium]MCO5331920.1 EamA family transporter RarD [Ilumatobacteraceae bacterium]